MRLVAANLIVTASLLTCVSAVASADVPENLRVPATQMLALSVQARGVQIYECGVSKADPARFEWIFKAPEADLYDQTGRRIGKHYAGPTWESDDGSKVAAAAKERADGPDVNAIPWLLLTVTSAEGNGVFGKTRSVQRLNTSGGKAPADGCDQGQLGRIARVNYSATYNFYVARP